MTKPTLHAITPNAVLLRWKSDGLDEVHQKIAIFSKIIFEVFENSILELVPTYSELAVYFKKTISKEQIAQLKKICEYTKLVTQTKQRNVIIPVCYEAPFALDINEVAAYHNISNSELIHLHTSQRYHVAFLGFLPGFPYLTGLPSSLHTPRKTSPRKSIAAGSVGIGGAQTGIYPQQSPGGWNIIGKTPVSLFDVTKDPPAVLKPYDVLYFEAINSATYQQIAADVIADSYQLEIRYDD